MPTQEWIDEVNQWAVRRRARAAADALRTHACLDKAEKKDDPGYFMRVALAFDQLVNALLGGDEDETISSRLGKASLERALNPVTAALVEILDFIDPNHVIDAIEHDEGRPVGRRRTPAQARWEDDGLMAHRIPRARSDPHFED